MKRKGFTLVELLAVIVILGIILLVAVPKIMNVISDSKLSSIESTV
ncbi:MAG TPA: type II secretion system protein, partial [Bacilli bacterium]|nr:type II secretion system protein [Bacilli bacterium]